MAHSIKFKLSFTGNESERHEIDLYDVSEALKGFQRSLSLTTHLVLNGEIITQAPSLKGAKILAAPPKAGSWEILALITVLGGGAYKLGTAPKNTPLGHIVHSTYDMMINKVIGQRVDYDKTLGEQVEEFKQSGGKLPDLSLPRIESLTEKCERAVKDIHRPIIESTSATTALISSKVGKTIKTIAKPFTPKTYDLIGLEKISEAPIELVGRISSYNSNTYKGRIFLLDARRPVPFELREAAKHPDCLDIIGGSLTSNIKFQYNKKITGGFITVVAFTTKSASGQIKNLTIIDIPQ